MAAALLTRAARGGALSGGLDLTRALSSGARAAHAAAAIKAAGGTGTGVHGAATALSGGGGAASSLTRAAASRLAGVRSMSTANGHGAMEPGCSCEREILQLRKELLDESRKMLDESRKNQALYGELAEQTRFMREYVTIKAETTMRRTAMRCWDAQPRLYFPWRSAHLMPRRFGGSAPFKQWKRSMAWSQYRGAVVLVPCYTRRADPLQRHHLLPVLPI